MYTLIYLISMSGSIPDELFKAYIVTMILNGKTIDALNKLSEKYGISPPKVKIGRIKGHNKALAVYSPRKKTIYIQDPDVFSNPFVVLHEFYHHLRYIDNKHRGTEKHADRYAERFIRAFREVAGKLEE